MRPGQVATINSFKFNLLVHSIPYLWGDFSVKIDEEVWKKIDHMYYILMVSCQKGHAYTWQIGPFWQDTLDIWDSTALYELWFRDL